MPSFCHTVSFYVDGLPCCISLEGCPLIFTVSFDVDGLPQFYWFVRRPSFSHSFILCGWFAPVVLVCKDAIF